MFARRLHAAVALLVGVLWYPPAFAAPPALDVNANSLKIGFGVGGTTGSCTGLSTTSTNDVIVVVTNNTTYNSTINTTTSVSGGGLTFLSAGSVQRILSPNWGSETSIWYAKSPSAIASQTFTATLSAATPELTVVCFAISGTDTTNPLDGNVSLPGTVNTGANAAQITVPGITTTRSNDFIVTVCSTISVNCGGPASGYTALIGSTAFSDSYMRIFYKTITSPLSSASIDIDGGPASGGNKGIVQAFTADGTSGGAGGGGVLMMGWP